MKTLAALGVCVLLAAPGFGQRRGGPVIGGGFRGGGGFVHGGIGRGGIGYPGHGGFRPGFGIGAHRFGFRGGFYAGYGYGAYLPYSYYPFMGFGYSDYWMNPYPYVWANPYPYTGYGYGYGYTASPSVTVVAPYPAEPAQPVVTQVYVPERAHPVVREYNEMPQAGGSVLYLIAFKDHGQVIRAALAYWVEGRTLHYLDLDHKEKQAPLDTVDAVLSEQLNRERRVPFHLPDTQ